MSRWLPRAPWALLALLVTGGCQGPVGDDDDSADPDQPMVIVPGGVFELGAVDQDTKAQPSEYPRHEVTLSDFRLDRHEVTIAAYREAVDAGVVEPPVCRLEYAWQGEYCNWDKANRDDHPVNGVDWSDADAYCAWRGLRLPTEAEFEYVLRARRDGAIYPWGDEDVPPVDYANVVGEETANAGTGWEHIEGYEDGFVGTAPVETFPVDPFGLFDISGNLWEWVSDWYDDGGYEPADDPDPTGPASGDRKVLRGGGFHCVRDELRCSERHNKPPDDRVIYSGFRCAADAD